jgi:hypothetical protein
LISTSISSSAAIDALSPLSVRSASPDPAANQTASNDKTTGVSENVLLCSEHSPGSTKAEIANPKSQNENPLIANLSERFAKESWLKRLGDSNKDRITLSRILCLLILILGIIHVLPATIGSFGEEPINHSGHSPRWVYLQFFIGGIHVLYVILIFQVPDWSTLRGISIAMLVFAFVFGVISTALLTEAGTGTVTNFLALSQFGVQRATLWCVLMLCLSTAVALVLGKEAADWRRAEQLMVEILSRAA